MAKEKKVADLNNTETKELLLQFIDSLQRTERNIKMLSDEKSDIVKEMKDEGFNTKIINKAIKDIRDSLSASPSDEAEKELYIDVLSDVIETIK